MLEVYRICGEMSDLVCTHRDLINWYKEKEQLPLKENDSTVDDWLNIFLATL